MTPSKLPGRGPLLAAAVFVAVILVVGFVALLRPPTDSGPVVTEPTTTTTDAGPVSEGAGLTTGPVRVGDVPTGLVLEVWEAGFQPARGSLVSYGPGTEWAGPGPRPQLAVQTRSLIDRPALDPQQILERLRAVHGAEAVTETTVRGRPALLVEQPDRTNGWTVAVLVFESDELISELQAAGLDVADVAAAAESLSSVDADLARQDAIDQIGWDLRVIAVPENAETFRQRLVGVDGVAQVTLRTPWFESRDLYFDATSESGATTTSAGTEEEDAARAYELVDALVHLDDGTDVETVAAAITEVGDDARVSYSPATATSRTLAFLDQLLRGAELVHDDPPIYQPLPGDGPNFDTSALGVDVPLHPATGDDDIADRLVEQLLSPRGFPRSTEVEPMAGPFFHFGRLDDDSQLLAAFGGIHPEFYVWHYSPQQEGGTTAGTGSSLAFYGYGVTGASSGAGRAHVFIAVPLNTAVYTYDLGGTRYQQQPVGGHGVLPVAAHSGTVTAYDQDGNILGSWQR